MAIKLNTTTNKSNTLHHQSTTADYPERFERWSLLTTLAVVVLFYPRHLQENWLQALSNFWGEPAGPIPHWLKAQFESVLSFQHSTLIFKGVVAAIPMLAFITVRLIRILIHPVSKNPTCPIPHSDHPGWAWFSLIVFLGWILVGAFWSPTPLLAREAAIWISRCW